MSARIQAEIDELRRQLAEVRQTAGELQERIHALEHHGERKPFPKVTWFPLTLKRLGYPVPEGMEVVG
jgi:hypothetical protein